jgi:hypothetical protein
VAGFRLFTDNHTRQPIVKALRDRGWDTMRAIDVFPEKTPDAFLFAHAADQGRAFATCDEGVHVIAMQWLQAGRAFRMVFWKHAHHARMSDGDLVRAFEEIAAKPNAFAYPIEYIKPKR